MSWTDRVNDWLFYLARKIPQIDARMDKIMGLAEDLQAKQSALDAKIKALEDGYAALKTQLQAAVDSSTELNMLKTAVTNAMVDADTQMAGIDATLNPPAPPADNPPAQ